jgi:hypothetical protein
MPVLTAFLDKNAESLNVAVVLFLNHVMLLPEEDRDEVSLCIG